MLDGFGQAPVCLELDLDSYDGPWTHVERFRGRSGWLVVAEAQVSTADADWATTLVAACDDYGEPVPFFMAPNLLACACSHPQPCREYPPDALDDLLNEAAHELRLGWLRENNAGLLNLSRAGAERVAALEAATRAVVDDADHRIADLRRRRRMPGVSPHAIGVFNETITAIEVDREGALHRLNEQRAQVRRAVEEEELALLRRSSVRVTWEPLYHVSWSAAGRVGEDELAVRDHVRSTNGLGARFAYSTRAAPGDTSISLAAILAIPLAPAPKPVTPTRSAKREDFDHLMHLAEKLAADVAGEERVGLMLGRRYRIRVAALRRNARELADTVNTGLEAGEPVRVLLAGLEKLLVETEATLVRRESEGKHKSDAHPSATSRAPSIVAPVASVPPPVVVRTVAASNGEGKLRIERAALARQLAELETTGQKFLRGSPKFERNHQQRADLAERIRLLNVQLAESATAQAPVELSLADQRTELEAELALHERRGARTSDGAYRYRQYRDRRLYLLGCIAELNTRIARQAAREERA